MKLEGHPPHVANYNWVTKNRPTGGGGVGILIRNDILSKTSTVDNIDQEDLETLWIRIKHPEKDITIGIFYGEQENERRISVEKQFNNLTTIPHKDKERNISYN